ncbi:tRNA pseudouridine synthase B (tRNA pseudouridine 55 synthase) [Propionibacterium freudenreichii]|uniref:tRNA pseudouridine(55) synthase TruB n=1 Tax=Propionibacterium freudenreichii TaxID=1744 RepID=UPI00054330B2|nr:tRNA pseudouridine(55) synthase TruB [Propionibacterium freudenreichii]CEH07404.1 tRNA pseudouridine synthase B (tRNA pseudouridine 55 synthase) [Propionibacterium freudenreichii]
MNRPDNTASGLLIVDKPAGLTSQQVVGRCRHLLGTRKVGHAGTLDPMATGVLIVGVNRATRLLGHLAMHDKRYLATIRLGASTTTDDAEGEVVAQTDASGVEDEQVNAGIAGLTGQIDQVPSSVSAIKVNGQRAYALVRKGQDVTLAARRVTVSDFTVLATRREGPFIDLDVTVECTSGTYVRALARDLGAGLGFGGHLTALRRTRIGRYLIDDAVQLPDRDSDQPAPPLMPMARAAELSFPVVHIDAAQRQAVGYGKPLDLVLPGPLAGLVDEQGELVALYRPDERVGRARPAAVLI